MTIHTHAGAITAICTKHYSHDTRGPGGAAVAAAAARADGRIRTGGAATAWAAAATAWAAAALSAAERAVSRLRRSGARLGKRGRKRGGGKNWPHPRSFHLC